MSKEKYAIIIPKTADAKTKMSYHGDRWIVREIVESLKFVREPGPWVVLISRDGKQCLHIKKSNDINFDIRIL